MMNPLLARFAGAPVLVSPDMAARFDACLRSLAADPKFNDMMSERAAVDDGFWPAPDDWRYSRRPYVVVGGMLQIPVKGVLFHDYSFASSWATGYYYIWRAFERGMADPNVQGIALICDSPGGEVAGCFDCTDKMEALRTTKPVRAFAHESAYSAAYALACVAPKIAMSRTAGVGSIGVYTMHVDMSKYLEKNGIAITFIEAPEGGYKTDGSCYEPLSKDAKARAQFRINELYDVFVAEVARNRGMSEEAVRATKAATFTASQATSNGLADSIGSLDDALAAYAADLSCDEQGEDNMANTPKDEAAVAHAAELDAARAEGKTAGFAEGKAEGVKEGGAKAIERVNAILSLDESKTRRDSAITLALTSDVSVDSAKAVLAKLPADKVEAPKVNTFEKAMEGGNPELGQNAEDTTVDADEAARRRISAAAFGTRKKVS